MKSVRKKYLRPTWLTMNSSNNFEKYNTNIRYFSSTKSKVPTPNVAVEDLHSLWSTFSPFFFLPTTVCNSLALKSDDFHHSLGIHSSEEPQMLLRYWKILVTVFSKCLINKYQYLSHRALRQVNSVT